MITGANLLLLLLLVSDHLSSLKYYEHDVLQFKVASLRDSIVNFN